MLEHHVHDAAEVGRVLRLAALEDVGQVAEQPRPAQAAAAHDHAVAARRPHHAQRVLRLPDVAVAEHRDARHGLLQPRDRVPTRLAVVELRRRAGVEPDGRAALVLADAPGVQVGEVLVVDPDPELDRHRHVAGGSPPRRARCCGADAASSGIAAPPPLLVTFRTGQPKFMSMWSTRPSPTRSRTASPT